MKRILHLALVQPKIVWENVEANLEQADKLLDKLSDETELVIFPEAYTTGFSMNPRFLDKLEGKPGLNYFVNKARELQKVIVVGLFVRDNDLLYNRYYWINPDGSTLFYNKRHLFSAAGEDQYFVKGHSRAIVSYEGLKFNLQLCYDLRFPVWSANQYDPLTGQFDYDILIYGANWPEKRKHIYLPLLRARAIENQAIVIWSNRVGHDKQHMLYSGDSRIVQPSGNVEITLKSHQHKVMEYALDFSQIYKARREMPVSRDWDRYHLML